MLRRAKKKRNSAQTENRWNAWVRSPASKITKIEPHKHIIFCFSKVQHNFCPLGSGSLNICRKRNYVGFDSASVANKKVFHFQIFRILQQIDTTIQTLFLCIHVCLCAPSEKYTSYVTLQFIGHIQPSSTKADVLITRFRMRNDAICVAWIFSFPVLWPGVQFNGIESKRLQRNNYFLSTVFCANGRLDSKVYFNWMACVDRLGDITLVMCHQAFQ